METSKAICYFVYCWDDEADLLEIIKKKVENQSNGRIKVILDRQDFQVAQNIDRLEGQILTADSVAIFFSPNYKKNIVEKKVERGVYREYTHIMEKYNKNPGSIIPVLFKGQRQEAIVEPFSDSIYEDITDSVMEKRSKRAPVLTSGKASIKKLVDSIISITENMKRIREPQFDGIDDKIEKLLKSNTSEGNLPKECIVDLKVYNDLYYQTNSFVMGRKGSGKSTILEVMERRDPKKFAEKYKTLNPIEAEKIDMETLYAFLQVGNSDSTFFDCSKVLKVYWETSLLLYGIYVVALEELYGRITDSRRRIFRKAGEKIKELTQTTRLDAKDIKRNLLNLCAEHINNYINGEGLKYASTDGKYVVTQVIANFTAHNMLSDLFGEQEFRAIGDSISACTKKIIIALDGFDTHSEDFRQNTNNYLKKENTKELGEHRKKFESLFYRSLIETVREARICKGDSTAEKIFKMFDYYIVLPRDRYDQIKSIDRDVSKYRFINLQWDAIELVTLVNLRLEFIYNINASKELDPKSRFEFLIKKAFPSLPLEIIIEIRNQTFRVDLFQYILSMSFWNPRDILAHITALADAERQAERDQNMLPDNNTIKRIIRQKAEEIIEKELYKEFGNVFINIRDVLSHFEGGPICLSIRDFCNIVSNIPFITNYEYSCDNIEQKIRLIYELGILGCKYPKALAHKLKFGTTICFVFNEGMRPVETILANFSSNDKRCEFVFNPILMERLSLQDNVLTVIGDYGWEYLRQNHIIKNTIQNA